MIEEIFIRFIKIIYLPFTSFEVLWSMIPIYLTWILTDVLAERERIDPATAMLNGLNAFWLGMDWLRQLLEYTGRSFAKFLEIWPLFFANVFMITWGIVLIYAAYKKRWYIEIIGRTRTVTYAQITLTPVMYGMVPLDLVTLISIIVFFPIVYFIMEGINRFVDKIIEREEKWGEEEW